MSDDIASTERPLREAIAEEVKVLMVRRNVSRARLAEALGVSHTTVWRRLSGEAPLDVDELEKIAGALGVDVFALFPAEVAEPTPVAPVEARPVTTTVRRRGRRLTASYPVPVGGTTPDRPTGHVAPDRRPRPRSPERPPSRPHRDDDARPVRLTRPATPTRTTRTPGDGVL